MPRRDCEGLLAGFGVVDRGTVEMRVMVVGATGTLGHRLCIEWADRFECWGTVRRPVEKPVEELLAPTRLIAGISAEEPGTVRSALEQAQPDVVVNCVGAVKQAESGQRPIPAIRINSLFPHELAAACRESSVRRAQISPTAFSAASAAATRRRTPRTPPTSMVARSSWARSPGRAC